MAMSILGKMTVCGVKTASKPLSDFAKALTSTAHMVSNGTANPPGIVPVPRVSLGRAHSKLWNLVALQIGFAMRLKTTM